MLTWLPLRNICVTYKNRYLPFVLNTSRSIPHSRLIIYHKLISHFITLSKQKKINRYMDICMIMTIYSTNCCRVYTWRPCPSPPPRQKNPTKIKNKINKNKATIQQTNMQSTKRQKSYEKKHKQINK